MTVVFKNPEKATVQKAIAAQNQSHEVDTSQPEANGGNRVYDSGSPGWRPTNDPNATVVYYNDGQPTGVVSVGAGQPIATTVPTYEKDANGNNVQTGTQTVSASGKIQQRDMNGNIVPDKSGYAQPQDVAAYLNQTSQALAHNQEQEDRATQTRQNVSNTPKQGDINLFLDVSDAIPKSSSNPNPPGVLVMQYPNGEYYQEAQPPEQSVPNNAGIDTNSNTETFEQRINFNKDMENKFNNYEGFKRVRALASLATGGAGMPIEDRGFWGKFAENTVYGIMTIPESIGGSIYFGLAKISATTEALIYPETRGNILPTYGSTFVKMAEAIPQQFNPITPEGLSNDVLLAAAVIMGAETPKQIEVNSVLKKVADERPDLALRSVEATEKGGRPITTDVEVTKTAPGLTKYTNLNLFPNTPEGLEAAYNILMKKDNTPPISIEDEAAFNMQHGIKNEWDFDIVMEQTNYDIMTNGKNIKRSPEEWRNIIDQAKMKKGTIRDAIYQVNSDVIDTNKLPKPSYIDEQYVLTRPNAIVGTPINSDIKAGLRIEPKSYSYTQFVDMEGKSYIYRETIRNGKGQVAVFRNYGENIELLQKQSFDPNDYRMKVTTSPAIETDKQIVSTPSRYGEVYGKTQLVKNVATAEEPTYTGVVNTRIANEATISKRGYEKRINLKTGEEDWQFQDYKINYVDYTPKKQKFEIKMTPEERILTRPPKLESIQDQKTTFQGEIKYPHNKGNFYNAEPVNLEGEDYILITKVQSGKGTIALVKDVGNDNVELIFKKQFKPSDYKKTIAKLPDEIKGKVYREMNRLREGVQPMTGDYDGVEQLRDVTPRKIDMNNYQRTQMGLDKSKLIQFGKNMRYIEIQRADNAKMLQLMTESKAQALEEFRREFEAADIKARTDRFGDSAKLEGQWKQEFEDALKDIDNDKFGAFRQAIGVESDDVVFVQPEDFVRENPWAGTQGAGLVTAIQRNKELSLNPDVKSQPDIKMTSDNMQNIKIDSGNVAATKTNIESDRANVSKFSLKVNEEQKAKMNHRLRHETRIETEQIQNIKTEQIQDTDTEQITETGLGTHIPTQETPTPPPETPPDTPMSFVSPTFNNSSRTGMFKVLVRRKGKFSIVGRAPTAEKAVKLGEKVVQNTAAASFKVQGEQSLVRQAMSKLGKEFYQSRREPGVIIQRSSNRINTAGEKHEIPFKAKLKKRLFR